MKRSTRLQYRALYKVCRLLGRLPENWLYRGLGRLIYFILYRLVRYRVSVVRSNLAHSFPEKSPEERAEIEHRFYHHLAEVFVDTIRLASISRQEILERMVYTNVEEHERRMAGKNWIVAMSHYGSWELTINYVCLSDHRLLAVYRPLHSKAFDFYYYLVRSRFGTQPIPMHEIYREVIRSQRPDRQRIGVALIADQTPPIHEIKHWYRFLSQDTPFFAGAEKMARRFHMPIVFMHVRQTRPRHYEAELIPIYDGQEEVSEYEITQRYVEHLEAMIRETPHLWMWSHRRWKHTRQSVEAFWKAEQDRVAKQKSDRVSVPSARVGETVETSQRYER